MGANDFDGSDGGPMPPNTAELERLLHNLVSATANVATAQSMLVAVAEKERDRAVKELANHLAAITSQQARK